MPQTNTITATNAPATPMAPEVPCAPLSNTSGKLVVDSLDDDFGFCASGVTFFKLALLAPFRNRPYHIVRLPGPFNLAEVHTRYHGQIFRTDSLLEKNGSLFLRRLLLRLGEDAFASLEGDDFIVYAATYEEAVAQAKQLWTLSQCPPTPTGYFLTVVIGELGPHTKKVEVERAAPLSTEELALHYGSDFPAWESDWTSRLRRRSSGLTILNGPPGCGKTSYLRALMSRLLDEAMFYHVPLFAADMLFSPRQAGFWLDEAERHEDKLRIVILEDAEDLLLPRDGGNRERVSGLLNLGDGLMGDQFKMHVICTTNERVQQLDPAIVRPGRLLGCRTFRRLTPTEAGQLARAKGLPLPEQDDYSLAEIYAGASVADALVPSRRMGFAV